MDADYYNEDMNLIVVYNNLSHRRKIVLKQVTYIMILIMFWILFFA